MEYRQLGRSGLRVSALTLGTMTFGGRGNFAKTGSTDLTGARRLIDISLDAGISRHHLVKACEESLRRLKTDYLDLYQLHEWDGQTPLDETLDALDSLMRSGKVRYVGCSNYSGWHLMKALAIADRLGKQRFVSQQIHYTLQAREAEYELVPIAI